MAPERARREPPAFRKVAISRVEELGPRLVRVTLQGPELRGLVVDQPAASVRILLPDPVTGLLPVPNWAGNEFVLPDGTRATIRTLTPRRFDPGTLELDVWVVVHGSGAASEWARSAAPGQPAAVSGPGRGYAVPADARSFLLVGDETALAALTQILEALPAGAEARVHVEVADAAGRIPLSEHPGAAVSWHELPPGEAPGATMVEAVGGATLGEETHVWAAGEAAAVQRIRRILFEERGIPRGRGTVRGYWKHGRSAQAGDEG